MSLDIRVYSENQNKETNKYVARAIKNCDKGSEFAEKINVISELPEDVLANNLNFFQKKGYTIILPDLRGPGNSEYPTTKRKYRIRRFVRDLDEVLLKEKIAGQDNSSSINHSNHRGDAMI